MRAGLAMLGFVASVAACMPQDGPAAARDDPLRPPGPVPGGVGIDPLIVGDRLLAAGEPELALANYVRAASGPGGPDAETRQAIAGANIALGRLGQAERSLRQIVADDPRNAAARNDLGVVLFELGKTGEAYQMLRTAFALQPSPEIRANLRLADARLRKTPYGSDAEGGFTLTRRRNGIYDLVSPTSVP